MNIHKSATFWLITIACLVTLRAESQQHVGAQTKRAIPNGNSHAIEEVGESANGLTLTTRFEKNTFKNGEPITVTVRLKNLRPTVAYFSRSRDEENFDLKVTTADGKPVPLTQYGRTLYGTPNGGSSITERMKQGDEVSGRLRVNRIYDMSADGQYNITTSTSLPPAHTVVISKIMTVTVTYDN